MTRQVLSMNSLALEDKTIAIYSTYNDMQFYFPQTQFRYIHQSQCYLDL